MPGGSVFPVDINIQDITALLAGSLGFPPMPRPRRWQGAEDDGRTVVPGPWDGAVRGEGNQAGSESAALRLFASMPQRGWRAARLRHPCQDAEHGDCSTIGSALRAGQDTKST